MVGLLKLVSQMITIIVLFCVIVLFNLNICNIVEIVKLKPCCKLLAKSVKFTNLDSLLRNILGVNINFS